MRPERQRSHAATASQQSVSTKCASVCVSFSRSREVAQCSCTGRLPGVTMWESATMMQGVAVKELAAQKSFPEITMLYK